MSLAGLHVVPVYLVIRKDRLNQIFKKSTQITSSIHCLTWSGEHGPARYRGSRGRQLLCGMQFSKIRLYVRSLDRHNMSVRRATNTIQTRSHQFCFTFCAVLKFKNSGVWDSTTSLLGLPIEKYLVCRLIVKWTAGTHKCMAAAILTLPVRWSWCTKKRSLEPICWKHVS